MSTVALPNTGELMLLIHRAISRSLDVSVVQSADFARIGYPDTVTRHGFSLYLRSLVTVVRAHHLSEDEVAFPYLRDKLPDVPFDQLMLDHQAMEGILEQLEPAAKGLSDELEPGKLLREAGRAASHLAAKWRPHIQIEEEGIYDSSAVKSWIDPEEDQGVVQQLLEFAQTHVVPPALGLPFVLYNLVPQDRAVYTSIMPPEVVEQLVPGPWRESWGPMQPFLLE